jgi:pilus assembly protein Flp/PilA
MIDTFKRLHRDDNGQDLVEYSLILALLGLAQVATMKALANRIASSFTTVGSTLASAVKPGETMLQFLCMLSVEGSRQNPVE